MSVVAAVEREVKLAMEMGTDLPDLRQVVAKSVRQPEQSLRAVYFDTGDHRLWNRGITLRHRTGDGTPKWTLKLPRSSTGDTLERAELEWDGDDEHMPDGALSALRGIARRASLQKIVELHTERIRLVLENDDGPWAELANDVVTVTGGQADGQRFRQVELEVNSSARDRDIRAVVKVLRRAGARPDPHPKLEKVLGPPERAARLRPKAPAENLVRQAISAGLARLLDHDCRIRVAEAGMDAEDVHQARVATRRLRSDLGTLKPLLDSVWVDHTRRELQWAGTALGAVRDIDVLAQGFREAGATQRLIDVLADERASAVQELREVLAELRYLDLLDRLHAASVRPPIADDRLAGRKASQVVPALVNGRWKKLRSDVRKGGRRPADTELHQIRKRSKQLRYASELASTVIGKPARRTAKASASLQTLLGEHHDAVVAGEWLRQAGMGDDIDTALEVAVLRSQETRQKKRLERRWRARYKKLARPRHRKWLQGG